MAWSGEQTIRWLNKLRYCNRVVTLPYERITKQVFEWDFSLNNKDWSCDMHNIMNKAG